MGVRSSWLMTSTKASRNSPAFRSSASNRSRSSTSRRRSVMSWPVPIIRTGRPWSSRRTRPAPCVQCTEPSGQTIAEVELERIGAIGGGGDRALERRPVVGMDRVDVRPEVRRLVPGFHAVLAIDRLGPGRARRTPCPTPRSRCPTPPASARCACRAPRPLRLAPTPPRAHRPGRPVPHGATRPGRP